ncbi:MAG: hypothetical protein UU47_C0016G0011 [candidate division TM6 bacterium GW2011_GWE2_41_16]|nr:MAG: hypothetical protein UU47_C0016G0011 [candidate division TM6 bacterium GW2011_GWE2_41_16]
MNTYLKTCVLALLCSAPAAGAMIEEVALGCLLPQRTEPVPEIVIVNFYAEMFEYTLGEFNAACERGDLDGLSAAHDLYHDMALAYSFLQDEHRLQLMRDAHDRYEALYARLTR